MTSYLTAFDDNQINYHYFAVEPEDLVNTIQNCIKKSKILLVGGGDGTIRSAAQHCVNTSTTLGVLPLGTMNHFVKELSLPADISSLLDAITKPHTIKIDLAEVNGLVFVNNSSLGFYPQFARRRNYYAKFYHKWLSYIPSIIQTFRHHGTFQITVKNEDLDLSLNTSFLWLVIIFILINFLPK
ncbi:diacylglycerol/lipid kinase family protein [Legionella tunisiensis]|uniref:diacylglycerol/lipid kinase family protein n=1 Tax=Legionella tunisiensis TaxID=1034944 RepID=UPI000A001BF4